MTITLREETFTAVSGYIGQGTVVVPAGKHLVIESSPDGEEVLDAEVPAGKTWEVHIAIHINET
jgi:hypothetical protein